MVTAAGNNVHSPILQLYGNYSVITLLALGFSPRPESTMSFQSFPPLSNKLSEINLDLSTTVLVCKHKVLIVVRRWSRGRDDAFIWQLTDGLYECIFSWEKVGHFSKRLDAKLSITSAEAQSRRLAEDLRGFCEE